MSLLICISLAFLIPVAESPLFMGVFVLGLAVTRAFILSEATTWFSLLLFLIYVGGMLVAFAYFLALCPNQSVSFSPAFILPLGIALFFLQDSPSYQVSQSLEILEIYRENNFSTFIILGIVLLLAIVRVVKIVSRSAGALRPLN